MKRKRCRHDWMVFDSLKTITKYSDPTVPDAVQFMATAAWCRACGVLRLSPCPSLLPAHFYRPKEPTT